MREQATQMNCVHDVHLLSMRGSCLALERAGCSGATPFLQMGNSDLLHCSRPHTLKYPCSLHENRDEAHAVVPFPLPIQGTVALHYLVLVNSPALLHALRDLH